MHPQLQSESKVSDTTLQGHFIKLFTLCYVSDTSWLAVSSSFPHFFWQESQGFRPPPPSVAHCFLQLPLSLKLTMIGQREKRQQDSLHILGTIKNQVILLREQGSPPSAQTLWLLPPPSPLWHCLGPGRMCTFGKLIACQKNKLTCFRGR